MIKKILEYITNSCYHIIKIGRIGRNIGMEEKSLTVVDVAQFFSSKEVMTHKKLQKLVYYAYAWYIALNNDDCDNIKNRLCKKTNFEAWVHGPVCHELYNLCSNNYGMVEKYNGKINELITGELKSYLEKIWKTFGKYTGDELESMTHLETPWINARKGIEASKPSNEIIEEKDMFIYYNNL